MINTAAVKARMKALRMTQREAGAFQSIRQL